jgi:hypothetical protein
MPVTEAALQALGQRLRAIYSGPPLIPPGQLVNVTLSPSPSELTALDEIIRTINLTWTSKDVRFVNEIVDNLGILGPMPIGGLFTLGTPGSLQRLLASVPIPTEVPVAVNVTWTLWSAGPPLAQLTQGEYNALSDLTLPELVVLFRPDIVELGKSLPAPKKILIRGSVVLSVGSANVTIRLPEVPVFVPAIAVPTIALFFLHSNFSPRQGDDDGAVLIVVPASSPLRSFEQLQPVMDALDAALSSLSAFASFSSFLLGVRDVTAALPAQPHIQFRAEDGIGNLNDITLIQRSIFENDTEAEDELSSLIFVGPPGRRLQCFNARDFDTGEGQLDIVLGPEMFAAVHNLHSGTPTVEPAGATISFPASASSFGDTLSSIRFG